MVDSIFNVTCNKPHILVISSVVVAVASVIVGSASIVAVAIVAMAAGVRAAIGSNSSNSISSTSK